MRSQGAKEPIKLSLAQLKRDKIIPQNYTQEDLLNDRKLFDRILSKMRGRRILFPCKVDAVFEKFIVKFREFGKIEEDDFHREMGKISGIPKCCIDNFIFLKMQNTPPAFYMHARYNIPDIADYVMCKDCVEKYSKYINRKSDIRKNGNGDDVINEIVSPTISFRMLEIID